MTKANSLEPPKVAAWLLEQFSPVLEAPLTGDLIESFRQGRSSGWYWRQTLWAILVALLRTMQKHWGRLAYAVVCSALISATWFSVVQGTSRSYAWSTAEGGTVHRQHTVQEVHAFPVLFRLYAKSYGIQWPWSLVYQIAFLTVFQTVIVAFALCAYFGFARILKAQNFLRASLVIVFVLAGSNVAATLLSALLGGILSVIPVPQLAGWVLIAKPALIALLVGMWIADPGNTAGPVSGWGRVHAAVR